MKQLNKGQKMCMVTLFELTAPDGEMCIPFAPLEKLTGFDRKTVRRIVRQLARKGLA